MDTRFAQLVLAVDTALADPRLAALGLARQPVEGGGFEGTFVPLAVRRIDAHDPLVALDPARSAVTGWTLRAGLLVARSTPGGDGGFLAPGAIGVTQLLPDGAAPVLPLTAELAGALPAGSEIVLFGRGHMRAGPRAANSALDGEESAAELRVRQLGGEDVAVSLAVRDARGEGLRIPRALFDPLSPAELAGWIEAWLAMDARTLHVRAETTLELAGYALSLDAPAGAPAYAALLGLDARLADQAADAGEGAHHRDVADALPAEDSRPARAAIAGRIAARTAPTGVLPVEGGGQARYRKVPLADGAERVTVRVDGGPARSMLRLSWHVASDVAAGPRDVWSLLLLARVLERADAGIEALTRDRAFLLAFGASDRTLDLHLTDEGLTALSACTDEVVRDTFQAVSDVFDRRRARAERDDAPTVVALCAALAKVRAAPSSMERAVAVGALADVLADAPVKAAATVARLAGVEHTIVGELSIHDRTHGRRFVLVLDDAPQDLTPQVRRARAGLVLPPSWAGAQVGPPRPEPRRCLTLTVTLVTPHGRPIEGAELTLAGAGSTRVLTDEGGGAYTTALPAQGDLQLVVTKQRAADAFDHRTLRATVFVIPEGDSATVRVQAPDPRTGHIDAPTREDDRVTVRVVLEYLWFTRIGYPPTCGNQVEVMADGERAWGAIADALEASQHSIHATTWIYQPSLELRRAHPLAEPEEREPSTIHNMLSGRAQAGTRVRLLLWDAPFISIPSAAKDAADDGSDGFEVLEQANPTRRAILRPGEWSLYNELLGDFQLGSYHQKTFVVDGEIGFCGGMNMKENDWDSHTHSIFEPRRCRFERHASFRERVQSKLHRADHPPRHDFMARVVGPSVAHLEANFAQRWNHLIDSGAQWAENATAVTAPAPAAVIAGPSQVQVVRTMPEPFSERGILDVYLRAIEHARRLIYIEDQYFRSTYVSDAIADAVRRWPELAVVVVTSQSQADGLVGGWTRECFERIRARRDDFTLHVLKIHEEDDDGDGVLVEVDNHAKLMIVDDVFVTVGSCNLNDRGFDYEGEINLAVVDPDVASRLRRGLFAEHLGHDPALESATLEEALALWRAHAEDNAAAEIGGTKPRSGVFPFEPEGDRLVVVGPDVF